MSNLVIVAIPDENDRVWKVSSEKIPHLTLLFLGDVGQVANTDQVVQFVEHAANTTLGRFYLPVDRRGQLGADEADVLFFKKGRYDYKAIRDFRMQLLKNDAIRKAYDGATQFDGPWNPHLTLGYPGQPAQEEDTASNYGGSFYDVQFNKIAVWMGDYEGPEFLLKDPWDEWDTMEAAPVDVAWADSGAEFLSHYGVKGMRWGVRNDKGGDNASGQGEKYREGLQKYLDPQGHNVGNDIVKAFLWPLIPPLGAFSGPSQIRLARGAARGAGAKVNDVQEKHFEAKAASEKNFVKIHNGASDKINRELDGINKKYTEADLAKPAKKKAYDAEVVSMMQGAYKESANSITNRKNTQHLDVEFHNDGLDFKIAAKRGAGTPKPGRMLDTPDGVSSVTKKVIKDHNELSDKEFKQKYAVGKDTYAKRVDKYGDPYMKSPLAKAGKKLAGAQHDDLVGGPDSLQHAEDDVLETITFHAKFLRKASGQIMGLDFGNDFDADFPAGEVAQAAEDGAEWLVHQGVMSVDDFLEHYGVKGMRWGVTREQLSSVGNAAKSAGGKIGAAAAAVGTVVADTSFENKLNSAQGTQQVETAIKTKANEAFHRTDLPAIKNKPEYQDAKKLRNRLLHPKDPATKAYRKEAKETYIKRLEEAANSMQNFSGTRQYTIRERGWELPAEGGALPQSKYYWDVSSRSVKHADGDTSYTMEILLDDDGFITTINEVDAADTMAQAMELGTAFLVASGVDLGLELEHYGVKGMRWGVRRDGVTNRATPVAVAPTATSRVRSGNRMKTKIEVEGGQNHDAHPDALKVAEAKAKLKKSGVSALSNTELREMQTRLQLEQQVKQLAASKASKAVKGIAGNQSKQQANQFITSQFKKKLAF